MPSPDFGKNIKWYEKYWLRQYAAKYSPANGFESDNSIAKDAYKHIMVENRMKKDEAERRAMIADIKYYRKRWAKVFAEIHGNPKDTMINEKVLAVLIPTLKREGKM